MSKLEKGLKEWVTLGFINQEQANKIHNHELKKPEVSWVLLGLLILGAVIVGLGIISLIAANWYMMPDALKLGLNFLLLVVLAFLTLRSWENKKAIYRWASAS